MKKLFATLALIITLTTGAFAGNENVKPEVLDAFNNQFATAQDVAWEAENNYYKVTFSYNDEILFAFYTTEGECMGITRYIVSTELPQKLKDSLKKKYADYWIADLFKVVNEEGTSYYITLQNANNKIVLESANQSNWKPFRI